MAGLLPLPRGLRRKHGAGLCRVTGGSNFLGGDLEEIGHEGSVCPHVPPADVVNLPLPGHRHRLVASHCQPCGSQAAEAEPGMDQSFDPPEVLLDDVVQVIAPPQPREAPQLARLLHVRPRKQVGRVLVHHDRARGFTVCGWVSALRKNRLATAAARRADSRKSMVWPRLSTARYK